MQDLTRALLLPLGRSQDGLAAIWDALTEQVFQAAVDRSDEPEALVVTALFDYCHDKEVSTVLVGQIAYRVKACRKKLTKSPI